MIFDEILGKFGYIKKTEVEKTLKKVEEERNAWEKKYLDYRHEVSSDAERNFNDRRYLESKVEKLENENENLKDQAWELKERLCDETQKRFELRERAVELESWRDEYDFLRDRYLEAKEQIKKLEEEATEIIWKDAKKDPPKNSKDVVVWSETGLDIGYYTENYGWVRKNGIVFKAKYWRELSEPDVSETKGE